MLQVFPISIAPSILPSEQYLLTIRSDSPHLFAASAADICFTFADISDKYNYVPISEQNKQMQYASTFVDHIGGTQNHKIKRPKVKTKGYSGSLLTVQRCFDMPPSGHVCVHERLETFVVFYFREMNKFMEYHILQIFYRF